MTPLEECRACARAVLTAAAGEQGLSVPQPIPLRLDRRGGQMVSALPRLLAAETGVDAQALARQIARRLILADSPFDLAEAKGGMIVLRLSRGWFHRVLDLYQARTLPPPPPLPHRRDEDERLFLLAYTVRRCSVLAQREQDVPAACPPRLLCALISGEPGEQIARLYWRLSPRERAYPPLARAVCLAAGQALDSFPA